jgi:hypothetical protein
MKDPQISPLEIFANLFPVFGSFGREHSEKEKQPESEKK